MPRHLLADTPTKERAIPRDDLRRAKEHEHAFEADPESHTYKED